VVPEEGVGDPGEGLAGRLGQLVQRRDRISEPQRVGATGVEVEVGGRFLGDLAILGLHLMTQPAGIDRVDDLGHGCRSAAVAGIARNLWGSRRRISSADR
jgi:hypothetical protein